MAAPPGGIEREDLVTKSAKLLRPREKESMGLDVSGIPETSKPQKSSRAGGLLASAEQVVPPFLIVGGLCLLFRGDHAQLGAVDADLGLDVAPPGHFA